MEVFLDLTSPEGVLIERKKMDQVQGADKKDGKFLTSPNLYFECTSFSLALTKPPVVLDYTLNVLSPENGISSVSKSRIPMEPSLMMPLGLVTRGTLNLYDYRRNVLFYFT